MTISVAGFQGQRVDPVTGCSNLGNGYRTFNAVLMRFHCPDSLSPFAAGGVNPYCYCDGDPVNRVDPSGHVSWQTGLQIGGALLGMVATFFTAGISLAVAGSLNAALASVTAAELLTASSGLLADVSAVASVATEQHHPQAAADLSWLSFATGILAAGGGMMLIAGKLQRPVVASVEHWGREVQDFLPLLGNEGHNDAIFIFTDTYRKQRRLNFVAHGVYQPERGAAVVRAFNEPDHPVSINGAELADWLKTAGGIDFKQYHYARLIMCHSADGGELSFAHQFSQCSGLPTKGFLEKVGSNNLMEPTLTRQVINLVQHGILLQPERINGYLSVLKRANADKDIFRMLKRADGYTYQPVKFNYPPAI